MSLPTAEEVKKSINARMKSLYCYENGIARAWVCLVCDQFTGEDYKKIYSSTLQKNRHYFVPHNGEDLSPSLLKDYKYSGTGCQEWMKGCMFSPRGIYVRNPTGCFVVCKKCHGDLMCRRQPEKAIANGWYFGTAPQEIMDLTESELALITPVKSFGYCFTYVGGRNQKLEGTLGYYKVAQESISRTVVVALKLSEIINSNIVYIMPGEFTEEQAEIVRRKRQINPQRVRIALEWLIANNPAWGNIRLHDLNNQLLRAKPHLVDLSTTVTTDARTSMHSQGEEAQMKEVEREESYAVYFPDGSLTPVYGGQTSAESFERIVLDAQKQGFDATVVSNLSRNFTNDYIDNNFVLSCLHQMPYGTGGPDEDRLSSDGDTMNLDLAQYARHLSFISNPLFHSLMFVLKLFNMKIRSTLLKTACQILNGNRKLYDLPGALYKLNFAAAAHAYSSGNRSLHNQTAQAMFAGVDSITKALPHTDEAAKRARGWMTSLQHHFGLGGMFITVTPDDENSFLVSAYSMRDRNGKAFDVNRLSAEELQKRAKLRRQTRIEFPGITSLAFEYVLNIVLEEVIGWDVKKNRATGKPGLFGIPIAYGGAIEEQGRTTLHVHLIIWIQGFDSYLDSINHPNERVRFHARRHICEQLDNGVSTSLIKLSRSSQKRKANEPSTRTLFKHECCEQHRQRKYPKLVEKQQLRNLRHKDCAKKT